MGFFEVRFWIKEFPGNGVISLLWQLRCQCNLIITNLHLYLIQLWWQLFQIFDNGDVVNTQTWEELTLKTPSSHHKHFFSHTLSPTLPGLPGIPSSPERPCKKNTIFAGIKFVVLLYSTSKERVLKYKGRENCARENFSLFTGASSCMSKVSCDRRRLLPPLKSHRPLHGSVYLLHYFRHGSALQNH